MAHVPVERRIWAKLSELLTLPGRGSMYYQAGVLTVSAWSSFEAQWSNCTLAKYNDRINLSLVVAVGLPDWPNFGGR